MFDQKQIGLRQHHCRCCGRAVCADCSPHKSVLPAYGFEYEVRICIDCSRSLTESDRMPLATSQEAKHSIINLYLDDDRGRLLSLGHDRVFRFNLHISSSITRKFYAGYQNLGHIIPPEKR